MAPKTPATTTQISKVELPAWVDAASQSNYAQAQKIASEPFKQFQGPRVAGEDAMTTQAYDLLKKNIGVADPYNKKASGAFDSASDLLKQASGPLDIQRFLNPWTSEVESNAMSNLDRQRQQSIMQTADQASSAGAFGGSRHGIQEGVTNAESARAAGDLSAKLRAQGWDTATANAIADMTNKRETAAGYGALGGQYQGLGESAQKSSLMDVSSLLSAGGQRQGQAQKVIDANRQKFDEPRNYDIDNLNLLLSSLGMSPYGKTESTQKTSTSEEKGPDWATTGLGVLQMLPALFALSDETMKTDIKRIGKDPVTNLSIYSYRYKGDPKTYPKAVGPMAQEVEKKYPEHVARVGGKLAVSPAIMAATRIAGGKRAA
jgi:hypothetical protein